MQTKDRNNRKSYCTKGSEAEIRADKSFKKGHPRKTSVFLPQTWVILLDTLQTLLDLVFVGHSYPGEKNFAEVESPRPIYIQTLEMGQSLPVKWTFWINSLFLQRQSSGKANTQVTWACWKPLLLYISKVTGSYRHNTHAHGLAHFLSNLTTTL